MERYVNKDEALKAVSFDTEAYTAINMLSTVEVVRCKDCKYGRRLTDANGYNYRVCNNPWGHGMMVEEYGFCKWGGRRDDGREVGE